MSDSKSKSFDFLWKCVEKGKRKKVPSTLYLLHIDIYAADLLVHYFELRRQRTSWNCLKELVSEISASDESARASSHRVSLSAIKMDKVLISQLCPKIICTQGIWGNNVCINRLPLACLWWGGYHPIRLSRISGNAILSQFIIYPIILI